MDALISVESEHQARNLIARASREVGGDYRDALEWISRQADSSKRTKAYRAASFRATRILMQRARAFRQSAKATDELQFWVDRGQLVFREIPSCPPEMILSQITGEREVIPCRHSRMDSRACVRPRSACEHGCSSRMRVIGCTHGDRLARRGEDHQ